MPPLTYHRNSPGVKTWMVYRSGSPFPNSDGPTGVLWGSTTEYAPSEQTAVEEAQKHFPDVYVEGVEAIAIDKDAQHFGHQGRIQIFRINAEGEVVAAD